MKRDFYIKVLSLALLGLPMAVSAQDDGCASIANATLIIVGQDCRTLRPITTAVPFINIGPDTRAGGMGDVGVATPVDANSQYWNAAKLAFAEDEGHVVLNYSPWLRQLVGDMDLVYLAGYKRLNDESAIGASLRYFNLGSITFTDINGNEITEFNPNEFAFDLSYSLKLSDRFSSAITARYINSNLTGGITLGGTDTKPARAVAVDVGAFYTNPDATLGGKDATFSAGFQLSNIGNKVSYTSNVDQDFLPANLRLGAALTLELDEYNKITFAYDANKLLVPTPPIYANNSTRDSILAGKDPEVSPIQGILQSFGDAPGEPVIDENGQNVFNPDGSVQIEEGSALREELNEIMHSIGIEYAYADQFFIRTGYFHEHATKGNRKYFTAGLGIRFTSLNIDLSYLIPVQQQNPLQRTLRIALGFRFAKASRTAATD